MSLGSIIGGVVGAVAGFFVGGPVGAFYGAALGFGVGMMVDPIAPDMQSMGDPSPEAQVMSGEIGTPIADLCGTAKITGHLLCFGGERNTAVKQKTSGGKGGGGGSSSQVVGYKYYMSWAVGICACPDTPVDALYAIYKNDDAEPVWPVFATESECENWEGVKLPVSGGQETIVIDDVGSVVFSFGTDDQQPIDAVGKIISDSTLNTPYRKLCWAFFDDCYIGEYNRTPTYKFIIKKIPQIAAVPDRGEIQRYDCNPAHALYYIFNVLSGLDVSWLDPDSFDNVATTLFNENRGICLLMEQQQSALNYIEHINGHVDNIVRYDSDGKFHSKLIRDDYNVDDLLLVDESVMLENPTFNRGSWIDTINEVKVQFTEIINVNRGGADIYGLYSSGAAIYGVRFDGNNLTELGNYVSPSGDINGLIIKNDELVTVGGSNTTASLRKISLTPNDDGLFPLLSELYPFNNYDITNPADGSLFYDQDTDVSYYQEGAESNIGGRFIKFDSALAKEMRGFIGTTVIGTDGNLYMADYVYSSYLDSRKPITGEFWETYYSIIPDNINDGYTSVWGVGNVYPNSSDGLVDYFVHDGFIYGYLLDSPRSNIRKYSKDGLLLLEYEQTQHPPVSMTAMGDYLYTVEGLTGAGWCQRYKINPSIVADTSVALPNGRQKDVIATSNYIIALNEEYAGNPGAIYKIDPISMSILDTLLLSVSDDWQKMAVINDTFIAIGGVNHIAVLNVTTMEIVDSIPSPTTASGQYSTRDLVVNTQV